MTIGLGVCAVLYVTSHDIGENLTGFVESETFVTIIYYYLQKTNIFTKLIIQIEVSIILIKIKLIEFNKNNRGVLIIYIFFSIIIFRLILEKYSKYIYVIRIKIL